MTHIDKVREALKHPSQWSTDRHDALSALQAHEAEDREREAILTELVATLVGIKVCAIIDGRPDWRAVAEQIDATLNKVKP